ncbi:hypothetical protein FH972_021919 [Carpinus fangiana]|uniref:cyclin-dependent kinase n=1 Tax=Carpinus fangiana TaxID=176857 RepID=A0A5N6KR34_9ROSI|nr:hypothetical protein FH972_021919 [Carpinus fangiana]
MVGRWADTEEEKAADLHRKREKEEKKRRKVEKQSREQKEAYDAAELVEGKSDSTREKLPTDLPALTLEEGRKTILLRHVASEWGPCRHVDNFERLNHIEEGSYGWVSRARELGTGDVVALKKLKMDGTEASGFPVTGLREIQCLMQARHRHIVDLREIVVGSRLTEVYLVMDFLEHDLKALQEDMSEPFMPSEIKTLLIQLTSAVDFLHSQWILHRDLKTSNILMNNRGEIKIADFGMARQFGDPLPKMTQLVVTLWYRAPELLLGAERYSTPIDMWSIGCIFGELLTREPLLQGKNEVEQLSKVFELCGIPTEDSWPGFKRLPNARSLRLPPLRHNIGPVVRVRFPFLTSAGSSLLTSLLSLDPRKRPSAHEMLNHPYFAEDPKPKSTSMFPTFPSKAGQEKRRRVASPNAPRRGVAPSISASTDFSGIFTSRDAEATGPGFQLRMM